MAAETIFSVTEFSVQDVFDWQWFAIPFLSFSLPLFFPKLANVWPFSRLLFFENRPRLNFILGLALIAVITAAHYGMERQSLQAQQDALRSGEYEIVVATFDGAKGESADIFEFVSSNMSVSFDGVQYDPPGSLQGMMTLRPVIVSRLEEGSAYQLYLKGEAILQIDTVSTLGPE